MRWLRKDEEEEAEKRINQQSFSLRRKISFICRHAVCNITHTYRHSISIDWQRAAKNKKMSHTAWYGRKTTKTKQNQKQFQKKNAFNLSYWSVCAHIRAHSEHIFPSSISEIKRPKGVRNLYRCMNLIQWTRSSLGISQWADCFTTMRLVLNLPIYSINHSIAFEAISRRLAWLLSQKTKFIGNFSMKKMPLLGGFQWDKTPFRLHTKRSTF